MIINDLKALGEKIKNEDFIHRFLMCLPKRFKMLRTLLFRGGFEGRTPTDVLGDVMTEDQLNGDSDDDKKKEEEKKKVVAFKATTSTSKGKGKAKVQEEEDDDDDIDIDDETMALFVRKLGKMMRKKGFNTRRRRDDGKSK